MTVTWVHVGNCPSFIITPKPEIKKHWSSMTGTKKMDKIAVTAQEYELMIKLDEWVPDNIILALFGAYDASDTTSMTIDIGAVSNIQRQVKLVGTNDIGAHITVILPNVFLNCNKAINFIGDDWGELEISGDVLLNTTNGNNFGTVQFVTANGAPTTPPSTVDYFIGKGNVYTGTPIA